MLGGKAVIVVDLGSDERARILQRALEPETKAITDRSTTEITVSGSQLTLEISAEDLTAMRAAINSFLAWISACDRTLDSVIGQNP
ncbi:KEOPS complex Pcc1-like subunit [Candidatus Thorarchaeota archaeon]|nr:MAG: KEOPS complex Pcc1-like subunit [Candidatus Thorarchaeota archaeon]